MPNYSSKVTYQFLLCSLIVTCTPDIRKTLLCPNKQVFTERLSVLGLQLNSELLAVEMMYSWSDTENIFVVTYGLVLLCGY